MFLVSDFVQSLAYMSLVAQLLPDSLTARLHRAARCARTGRAFSTASRLVIVDAPVTSCSSPSARLLWASTDARISSAAAHPFCQPPGHRRCSCHLISVASCAPFMGSQPQLNVSQRGPC